RRGVRDSGAGRARPACPDIGGDAARAAGARGARPRRSRAGQRVRARSAAVPARLRGERPTVRARAARTPGRGGRGRAWLCAALLALTPPVLATSPADSLSAETAIAAMHRYLAGAVDEEGWFLYRHDAQGRRLPGYNIVRHAGTLLAMSQG